MRQRQRLCSVVLLALTAFAIAVAPLPRQAGAQAPQTRIKLPVLVPITGILSLEGTSQRNGALLAIKALAGRVEFDPDVIDTVQSPEAAITAWHRALRESSPLAVVGPIFGPQMLALMPLAAERGLPLLTISGTARLSDAGNPWFFRFFPSDAVVKVAHARYVIEELHAKRPAILYQTTAYGQSGREQLARTFAALNVTPVLEAEVTPQTTDLTPIVRRALSEANADVLVLHLHAESTAKAVIAARKLAPDLPIVAGSAMHQPATSRLVPVGDLKNVCAETASSPVSAGEPAEKVFLEAYRGAFNDQPDAYALAQYDAVMALGEVVQGLRQGSAIATPEAVRKGLAEGSFSGIAMRYRSDGHGNMAHQASIVCFDGNSPVPQVVKKYDFSK